MKVFFAIVGSVSLALAGCATRSEGPAQAVYGAAPAGVAPVRTLEETLTEANVGRTVAVRARVAEVCRMKGCWMVLTDGALTARVTFKDYGFFVPKDLAGKTVVAEGTLSRKTLTADEAEHLDRESSSSGSTSPAAATPGPREEWSLVAASVVVPGGS